MFRLPVLGAALRRRDPVRRPAARAQPREVAETMRVMAFVSQSSGSGKTTLAGHVGVQAQLHGGAEVALLDADAGRDLSRWSAARDWAAPQCIGAKLRDLEGLLQLLRISGVDLAVIDAPAADRASVETVAELSDLVVVPASPAQERLPVLAPTVRLAESLNRPFVFLLNQAKPNSKATGATALALAQHGTVSPVVVPQSKGLAETMRRGLTVVDQRRGPAKTIGALWNYLAFRLDQLPADQGHWRGKAARERRAFPRWRFDDDGVVMVEGRALPCSINDISASGLSVFMQKPPVVGQAATIHIPRLGSYPVQVVSRVADRVGLRFDMDGRDQWDLVKNLSKALGEWPDEIPA